jgi:prevent-host-death family protein
MIMPIQTVNLDKVENQLAELLAFAEDNGEIVIAQNGKPLARLEPVKQPKKKKRIAGLNRGMIWSSEDFDEPLPDEFWLGKD